MSWRELAVSLCVLLAYDLLHGCYLEHDAASSGSQAAFEAAGSGSILDAATERCEHYTVYAAGGLVCDEDRRPKR